MAGGLCSTLQGQEGHACLCKTFFRSDPVLELWSSGFLAIAMAVSLKGVPEAWDNLPELRTRVRDQGTIFRATKEGSVPDINIKDACLNADVIKPVLRAMAASPRDMIVGGCLLFTIAAAETALLG